MTTPTPPPPPNDAAAEPPELSLSSYCEGCGEEKTYRGRGNSSAVACNACWKRLPRWLRNAFVIDMRRPAGIDLGPSVWETRLRQYLRWMKEAKDGE